MSRVLAAAPAAILTAEFVTFDFAYYVGKPFGNDARLYLAATQTWLSGGDPWNVASAGIRFAGVPVTLLPFAPFAWLSPEAMTVVVLLASVVAAVFVVQRVGLPVWWLLFPPLIEAIWSGSVNIIVLALALTRLEWLAVVTKTYTGLPALLLGHIRQLAIAAVVVVITVPFLPWGAFLSHDLGDVLTAQAWGGRSAWINPLVLVPVSLAALALAGRQRAAWWSVPVLWPATQFHYSIFAMPAKPSALAAGILAIPWPGAPVAAIVAEAAVRRWGDAFSRANPLGSAAQERDSVPVQVVR